MERADGGSKKSTVSFFITFLQGGQGRFRFLPLGPPAPPVTPLKRSLREGVRHCTPSLYCNLSCPRLRGKCRGVAVTKGEWLKAAKCRELFPLSRLTPTVPPQAVAPFGGILFQKFKKRSSFRPAGFVAMGRKLLYNACIGAAVCIRAEERLYA